MVPENKQAVPQIEETFGKFMFYRLSEELKMETSFMILANLSTIIRRRSDLMKLVTSFLGSQVNKIIKIESHLVILRIVRTVSYYPSAIYFMYIETQINQGKIFIL